MDKSRMYVTLADSEGGIEVVERLPCEVDPTEHSLAYLQTKKQRMGHTLALLTECPA
jgi:GTP cyclohydrolase II